MWGLVVINVGFDLTRLLAYSFILAYWVVGGRARSALSAHRALLSEPHDGLRVGLEQQSISNELISRAGHCSHISVLARVALLERKARVSRSLPRR